MLLHGGAFQLDVDSQRATLWHRLAPRTRVLCTFLFVFATALTPHGHWETWGVYALGLFTVLLLSRVTLRVLLQRVAVEFSFIGVVLLGTLFRDGGEILWQWGWFRITEEGLLVLGSVALRALLSLLMLNLLVLTTSVSDLLEALVQLKTPSLLVAILSSMYRYIEALTAEVTAMRRAAASRNLIGSHQWRRLVVGHSIGSLFIRTYERGDRIYQAMLARGYHGLLIRSQGFKGGKLDILALTGMAILVLSGQMLYFFKS